MSTILAPILPPASSPTWTWTWTWTWSSWARCPDRWSETFEEVFPDLSRKFPASKFPDAASGNIPPNGIAAVGVGHDRTADVGAGKKRAAGAVFAQSPLISLGMLCWRRLCGFLARSSPSAARDAMRVIGHLGLGGRKTLVLVEVDGQRYLVGGSADSVTAIVSVCGPGRAPSSSVTDDANVSPEGA